MRTYDNLCAITESSNLTFPMTRLAVSTFIANNLWFDGTIIIATIKNNGLNQSNIDILKSIYEKVEILEIDHKDPIMQGVASKLLKKNIPSDRVLDYLNILAFNIKSEGNIYFSRNTVFMGDVSDMLDSNHLVAPTDSNNFPILDDFSDSSINSKLMFVPKYLISNSNYSIVARCNSGGNAGHKVVIDNNSYAFHMVPSGILNKFCTGIIGNGCVVNLEDLKKEITTIEEISNLSGGIYYRLFISNRAHIVLPIHKIVDGIREDIKLMEKGNKSIGTTRQGMGPVYSTKALRVGLRMCDLLLND